MVRMLTQVTRLLHQPMSFHPPAIVERLDVNRCFNTFH